MDVLSTVIELRVNSLTSAHGKDDDRDILPLSVLFDYQIESPVDIRVSPFWCLLGRLLNLVSTCVLPVALKCFFTNALLFSLLARFGTGPVTLSQRRMKSNCGM